MNDTNEKRCTEWLSAFCVMLQQGKLVQIEKGDRKRDADEQGQRGPTSSGEQRHV